MKKMSTIGLFVVTSLSVCNAQTNGIAVSLAMPGVEMLVGEQTPITVSITNGSDRAIPIIKDNGNAFRFQVQLDVGAKELYAASPIESTNDRRKTWQSLSKVEDFLNPGESFVWTLPYTIHLTILASKIEATNITARVVIGDNEWVSSARLPFYVSNEDKEQDSPQIECYDLKTREKAKYPLRKIKLGDKSFIFTVMGYRLCEVSDNDMPEVLFDSEKQEVIISSQNNKRSIRYDETKFKWGKGTVP